jgi:gluconokinase
VAAMRAAGLELDELRATGGFTRSRFWRQLLADVLGSPVGFSGSGQGSATGAALLGHVALGHVPSLDDAAATVRITDVVEPSESAARFYRDLLPVFSTAGDVVDGLHAAMAAAHQEPVSTSRAGGA